MMVLSSAVDVFKAPRYTVHVHFVLYCHWEPAGIMTGVLSSWYVLACAVANNSIY